ncbi:MAG: hypothetical protein J3Q66DRAFT_56641 [Benniella sp.]|nr:MAG: hypothetical protein J3Q66DRAFT_56641 [Benniella sp.]
MFNITELDDMIYRQLSRYDLTRCARVCKKWHEAVIPFIWRDLAWLESSVGGQQQTFGRLVLKDYLHEHPRHASPQGDHDTGPPSSEPSSSVSLSSLAKHGPLVQTLPDPRWLWKLFHFARAPPQLFQTLQKAGRAPSPHELLRHLYQHCPITQVRLCKFIDNDFESDGLLKTAAECLAPRAHHLYITNYCSRPLEFRKLKYLLDHCSSALEELSLDIHISFQVDDIPEEEAQEDPKPWSSLKQLSLPSINDDSPSSLAFWTWLWKRCSQMERLKVTRADRVPESAVDVMSTYLPNLNEIQLGAEWNKSQGKSIAMLLDRSQVKWKAVELMYIRDFGESARTALAKHFHTLEKFHVNDCDGWTGHDLLRVLTCCPRLQSLIDVNFKSEESHHCMDAYTFIDRDPATESLRTWPYVTTLRELNITISGIPRPDLSRHATDESHSDDHGREIQRLVYGRLAQLVNLETLGLGGHKHALNNRGNNDRVAQSDCLEMSLESGLWKLGELKSLKKLILIRMRTRIGLEEVQWMTKHWPRLQNMYGFMFNIADSTLKALEWLKQHHPEIKVIK